MASVYICELNKITEFVFFFINEEVDMYVTNIYSYLYAYTMLIYVIYVVILRSISQPLYSVVKIQQATIRSDIQNETHSNYSHQMYYNEVRWPGKIKFLNLIK